MKKRLLAIFISILSIFALSACVDAGSGFSSISSDGSVPDSSVIESADSTDSEEISGEEKELYSITYIGIKEYDKSVLDIPSKMMPSTKSYPLSYSTGSVCIIDDLQYAVVSSVEYEFVGYYTNAACTDAFTGVTENTVGELTLYALIRVYHGTPNV